MKISNKKNKKGFTLVELMVAMGLFTIITTLAVGAFISANNMRALAMTMKESQQKLRMSMEMISRSARQAEKVVMGGGTKKSNEIKLFYGLDNNNGDGGRYGKKFLITGGKIYYAECEPVSHNDECDDPSKSSYWKPDAMGVDVLGGDLILDNTLSYFEKNQTILGADRAMPPSLVIFLNGKVENIGRHSLFYSDAFSINTRIILENIK